MSRLSTIKRPITSCNKPVIKLVTTTECTDQIGDSYYGTGDIIDGSVGATQFPFQKITNLRGFIKDIPREIIRQNSLNCRVQKVSSSVKYDLQGGDAYPSWKMRELEEMFHGKQIIVDGQEVLFSGGTMFTELGSGCPQLYRLRTTIEECRKEQIYGCQSECTPNCYFFRIPSNIVTQNFFNEAGAQIASNYNQLLEWYRNQSNVKEVIDVEEVLQIACDYYKVFKVIATGYIPSFIFFDNPSQTNKVYGVSLDCDQPDYSKLCGNIDNRSCGALDLDIPFVFELECGAITITDTDVFEISSGCGVAPFPNWQQHTGTTSIIVSGNLRTLNLSVYNEDYPGVPPIEGSLDYLIGMGDECGFNSGLPIDADVYEVQEDGVPLDESEWSYNMATQDITFLPCVDVGDIVTLKYHQGGASPTFSGQIIATITGPSCLPLSPVYQTNSNNASIPAGATILIEPNGNIRWYGMPTSYDAIKSIIEVTGISYTV